VASKPIEPFEVVVVTWVDAYQDGSAQVNTIQEALDIYKPAVRQTVGHLVHRDDKLTITADTADPSKEHPNACGGLFYIPSSLVVSVTRPRKRRAKK